MRQKKRLAWEVRDGYGNTVAIATSTTIAWWFAAEDKGYFGRSQYIDVMKRDGYSIHRIYIRDSRRSG